MGRIWIVAVVAACALCAVIAVKRMTRHSSASNDDSNAAVVVVLVDFSKSFVPGGKAGLLDEDERTLHDVAQQLVLLAAQYRTVKILWFPIVAAAPTTGLCEPIEVHTSLVKRGGDAISPDDVEGLIGACDILVGENSEFLHDSLSTRRPAPGDVCARRPRHHL